jgi:hypothetical protein
MDQSIGVRPARSFPVIVEEACPSNNVWAAAPCRKATRGKIKNTLAIKSSA